jgi:hypothetical protein
MTDYPSVDCVTLPGDATINSIRVTPDKGASYWVQFFDEPSCPLGRGGPQNMYDAEDCISANLLDNAQSVAIWGAV